MTNIPIYDYVMYYNEVELLELRYHVLKDHVESFTVVESNFTFSGQPKPYRCRRDIERVGLPAHRFNVIELDLSPDQYQVQEVDQKYAADLGVPDQAAVWSRQRLQRDALCDRLESYPSDAVFLIGDVDEIPRPQSLQFVASMLQKHQDYVLKLPLVLLEGRADQQIIDEEQNVVWWDRSLLMCRWAQLTQATPWQMRSEHDLIFSTGHAVVDNQRSDDLGWHFTWMGTPSRRVSKVQACAHGVALNSINNMSDRTRRELVTGLNREITFNKYLSTRPYPTENLPPEIWNLPRVKDFLLPEHDSQQPAVSANMVQQVLTAGGSIKPLIIKDTQFAGTALFNPTVLVQGDDIMINIRHCQYTLLHLERNIFEHEWGPLSYLHPENDLSLTTVNYWGRLDHNLDLHSCHAVDTKELDVKPLWDFVGLEDVRIAKWHDKLYYCGVRRDTTPHGQGRMELSVIDTSEMPPRETHRQRMPAPGNDLSYCEKNWMPVLDQPYTFVKWCNPTEVVRFDPESGVTQQIYLGQHRPANHDFRGGSQVIRFHDHYVAITHAAFLYRTESGRKDATYRHCFVVWDLDWNVIHYSEPWSFLDVKIEFCCGMALWRDQVLMTFGVQDNAAYVLSAPQDYMRRLLNV